MGLVLFAFCQPLTRNHPSPVLPQARRMLLGGMVELHVLSRKPITFPVRPPTLPSDEARPFAAPEMAGPAADVTLDKPCWALDVYSAAVDEALEVASFAVSVALAVVLDSNLRAAMRRAPDWRSTGRVRAMETILFDLKGYKKRAHRLVDQVRLIEQLIRGGRGR